MGKVKSKKEKKLQRKLIPVNIVVCIIALVAALSLFLTPILKIDVGKILRDEATIEYVDKMIDDAIDDGLEGSDQEGIDYKPVVAMLVRNILGKAEGSISVSAVSAMKVLTSGEDKSQTVLDELFFGDKALATSLINSVVDGVADMFETEEGREVLEEAIISTLSEQILKDIENKELAETISKNVKELVGVLDELGEPSKVPDGKVDGVVNEFVDKLEDMLGGDTKIGQGQRDEFINTVQELYDTASDNLKEGEKISMESLICVAISKSVDLSELNIEDMLGGFFSESESESSVHIKSVDEELKGDADDEGGVDGSETDGNEEEVGGGSTGDGDENSGSTHKNNIVTNYNDLLSEMGFDKEAKENLKNKMRTTLNTELNNMIKENGIDEYLAYYSYVFYGMLVFIVPWLILFLFSFFHLLAKNKRFMMWYVKLICWIPSVIWLALTALPALANKVEVISDLFNGDEGGIIQAALRGITSYTWINGLCLVLLWFVSIFWAFPIKHKIRKERKYPEVVDADYDDDDDDY